jgi:hypothetical protein
VVSLVFAEELESQLCDQDQVGHLVAVAGFVRAAVLD